MQRGLDSKDENCFVFLQQLPLPNLLERFLAMKFIMLIYGMASSQIFTEICLNYAQQ